MKATKQQEQEIRALRQIKTFAKKCFPHVYAKVVHVSASGMSREIQFYLISKKDGSVYYISYTIAQALGWRYNDSYNSVHVDGCGMDMIFHTLYCLNSQALHYGVIRVSKKRDNHDCRYKGLVNSSYIGL